MYVSLHIFKKIKPKPLSLSYKFLVSIQGRLTKSVVLRITIPLSPLHLHHMNFLNILL